MSTSEKNPNERDETAEYIEDRMRQMVMDTIAALSLGPARLPVPTTEFDFDRGYLTLTVSDQAALAAWRRHLFASDMGDDLTRTSWCGWQTTIQVARPAVPVQTERSDWDPYALPAARPVPADCPNPEQWEGQEHRRSVIAGLRMLATYLEDNPAAPTPDSVEAGVVFIAGGRAGRLAAVQDFVETVGAEPDIDDDFAAASRHFGPVEYRALASLPEPTTAEIASAALEA